MQIAELKSLGPKSQQMLEAAGIRTIEDLTAVGSVTAFVRVRKVWPKASLNLLWALESAVTGIPWQVVARRHRTSLLLAVDEAQKA